MTSRGAEPARGRPAFHFTPPHGWLNDPNGLVADRGTYHLCYQHHPDSDRWGPMHWGHAVSRDLVRWEHRPVALRPGPLGWAYSGSAVVDRTGAAGFGAGALVAIFTHASGDGQVQSLAASRDGGATWQEYDGNPVLAAPGEPDFRDPKVFRWGGETGHWVMVLAAGRRLLLFTSPDLRRWEAASEVVPAVAPATLETPDLFPLPAPGGARWILAFGVTAGGPGGGTGTCYVTGGFDGHTFVADPGDVRPADHGPDCYAAQTWSGAADPTWIAWMGNWAYAERTPAAGWRGSMTIPRRLGLVAGDGAAPRLAQAPVASLAAYRSAPSAAGPRRLAGTVDLGGGHRSFDLEATVDLAASTAERLEVAVFAGPHARTTVSCDLAAARLTLDRGASGAAAEIFGDAAAVHEARVPAARRLSLRLLGDEGCLEVFANGEVLTALTFPPSGHDRIEVSASGGTAALDELDLFRISLPAGRTGR